MAGVLFTLALAPLLSKLAIKGCLITADAISCQKKIAKQVLSQQADYLLAVKNNQPTLYQTLDQQFMTYWAHHPEDHPDTVHFSGTIDHLHGRGEHRILSAVVPWTRKQYCSQPVNTGR